MSTEVKVGQVWKMYGCLRKVHSITGPLVIWDDSDQSYISNLPKQATLVEDVGTPQVTPQVDACAALRSSLPTVKAPVSMIKSYRDQFALIQQRLRVSIATYREWPACPVSGKALGTFVHESFPGRYHSERKGELTARFHCELCEMPKVGGK
jgi:hypothetical protein